MSDLSSKEMSEKSCGTPNDDTFCGMIKDFYNRKMLPVIILVWVYSLILIALAIFSAVRFFRTDELRCQIMYAVIFIGCMQFITLIKIFAWQMIHRNGIKRAIKALESRIEELSRDLKAKP